MIKIIKLYGDYVRVIRQQYEGHYIGNNENSGSDDRPIDVLRTDFERIINNIGEPYNAVLSNNKLVLDTIYTIVEYDDRRRGRFYVLKSDNNNYIGLSNSDIKMFLDRKEWITNDKADLYSGVIELPDGKTVDVYHYRIGSTFYINWNYLNNSKDCKLIEQVYTNNKFVGYNVTFDNKSKIFMDKKSLAEKAYYNQLRVLNTCFVVDRHTFKNYRGELKKINI